MWFVCIVLYFIYYIFYIVLYFIYYMLKVDMISGYNVIWLCIGDEYKIVLV